MTNITLPNWIPALHAEAAVFSADFKAGGADIIARLPFVEDVEDINTAHVFTSLLTGDKYSAVTLADTYKNISWYQEVDTKRDQYAPYTTQNMVTAPNQDAFLALVDEMGDYR